jgi:uncharacterized cupredoxin-like copper-binding protein
MSTKSIKASIAVLIVLSAFAAACSSAPAATDTGARQVTLTMSSLSFSPSEIRVKVGQPVRLTLQNNDTLLHDFSSMDAMVKVMHGEGAAHDMDSEMSMHVAAEAGQQATLEFKPTQTGTYEFFCSVAGHKEAGMLGKLIVEP